MSTTLIVARMAPEAAAAVARAFAAADAGGLPRLMGVRRRELFSYGGGLYLHAQEFEGDGAEAIARAREHPLFAEVSARLRPHISPYDPGTWRSPADALATCFYRWPE